MIMNTLATFELTKEMTLEFLNDADIKNNNIDYSNFPFSEFSIIYPVLALSKGDEVFERLFNNRNMTIYVKEDVSGIDFSLYDYKDKIIQFKITENGSEIVYSYYKTNKANEIHMKATLNIVFGVMNHYLKPTTIVEKSSTREKRVTSVLKDYNSSSKKYIYKTKYVFNGEREEQADRKPLNRRAESWLVSGHIRRYRDADGNITKEVYVKPYKKGTGSLNSVHYKITRA